MLDKGICGGLSNEREEVKKVEFGVEKMRVIMEKNPYLKKGEEHVNELGT